MCSCLNFLNTTLEIRNCIVEYGKISRNVSTVFLTKKKINKYPYMMNNQKMHVKSWLENLNIFVESCALVKFERRVTSVHQWWFHGRISAIVNGEFVSVAHDFLTVWGIEGDRKPRYVNVADIRWIGTENRAPLYMHAYRGIVCI